jgi:hypothetical protein
MKRVDVEKSNKCPYCNVEMDTNEGTSETHQDGTVIIQCAYCGKEYYYYDKNLDFMGTGEREIPRLYCIEECSEEGNCPCEWYLRKFDV